MTDLPRRSGAEAGAAVAVEGLTKVFPVPFRRKPITAVRDLNLRVEAGEVYGLLELVGLTNARDQRLSTYSKGMLQRIGLAQALINEPKLVVLDEPTAGVDPAGSRDIRKLIADLKQRGITVLFSSHLLTQVQEICDHVGILARGVLVREGRLEELIAIENRSELVLENASEDLVKEIEKLAANSNARLIDRRKSTTTLERLFLEATQEPGSSAKHAK